MDYNTVKHIADLAKLEFDDAGLEKISKDLEQTVEFVRELSSFDTENYSPKEHISDRKNVFREDIPKQDYTKDQLLSSSNSCDGDYITVPTVMGDNS